MRRNTVLVSALSALLLLGSNSLMLMAHADEDVCSLESLKGTYAIHSEGQWLAPAGPFPVGPIGEAGMVTLDGKGTLAGHTTLNFSGNIVRASFTGTYEVTPQCDTTFSVQSALTTLHLTGVIIKGGKEIVQVSTDPGFVLTSDLKKI